MNFLLNQGKQPFVYRIWTIELMDSFDTDFSHFFRHSLQYFVSFSVNFHHPI